MASVPYQTSDAALTAVTPNPQIGASTSDKVGFYGTTPVAKPTVTGSKGSNAALTSLIAQLVALGLIVDSTS